MPLTTLGTAERSVRTINLSCHSSGVSDFSRSWSSRLAQAIDAGDDAAVNQLVREGQSLFATQDLVAQCVGRTPPLLVRGNLVRPFFAELWAIPMLVRDAGPLALEEFWLQRKERIRETLAEWAGSCIGVSLYHGGLIPAHWVASWTIAVVRAYLDQLSSTRDKTGIGFEALSFNLPEGLPRLCFIPLALKTSAPWPSDFVTPYALECAIQNALSPYVVCPDTRLGIQSCGAPSPLRHAFVQGLMQWISEIHECAGIAAWDITLNAYEHSKVELQVVLLSGEQLGVTLNANILGASALTRLISAMVQVCEYRLVNFKARH